MNSHNTSCLKAGLCLARAALASAGVVELKRGKVEMENPLATRRYGHDNINFCNL